MTTELTSVCLEAAATAPELPELPELCPELPELPELLLRDFRVTAHLRKHFTAQHFRFVFIELRVFIVWSVLLGCST